MSHHPMDEFFLFVDECAAAEKKETPLQKLRKLAGPPEVMLNPPALSTVLDLPTETPDPVDNWQTFAMYKASKTFSSTERLGSTPSLTKVTPLTIAHDPLLKALETEITPEPANPVLAKLQSASAWRREGGGVGKSLDLSTAQLLEKIAQSASGPARGLALDFATRAREWGL